MSIVLLLGIFCIGGVSGALLYFSYVSKHLQNSTPLPHFSLQVENRKNGEKSLLTCVQEEFLKSSPFEMLWCIVDIHKRIVLRHEDFSYWVTLSQSAYALQLFRSTEVESRIACALRERKPDRMWNVSFLESQWDVHIIPFIRKDVRAHDVVRKKHSQLDEVFAIVTCMPTTKGRGHGSDGMEEEFLQNVAHEIKNPLTSIIGFSELLYKDAQNKKIVERIQRQGKRLFSIVENIAFLTQHSTDARFDEIRIHDCVTGAMEQLEEHARSKHIHVEYEFHESEVLRVMGDATLLTIACKNVLENAIQHSKMGEIVTVESSIRNFENKSYVVLCITDRGEGIASVDKDKIFDRFYRGNVGKSRARGGTGLGLAITKKVLELHGGTISVESTVNKGSTFTISIPTMV